MKVLELVNRFNKGDDIARYFGGIDTFFKVVNSKGLLHLINPTLDEVSEYQNNILIAAYNENIELFHKWMDNLFTDVEFINGKAYLILPNKGELSKLFCERGRSDIPRETIESILDGEYDMDYYDNSTDDVYRDVIEELTKENLLGLKEYIVTKLNGVRIEPKTSELEFIAQEQGHPEYVIVDNDSVDRIVDDKETMEHLFENQLDELRGELYSIHSQSYNDAYQDELYEMIWDKLSEFFNGKAESYERHHRYYTDRIIQEHRIEISDFDSEIVNYLKETEKWNEPSLEHYSDYLEMLKDQIECLRVYVPDYPSSSKVDSNINLYFKDYI